MKLLYVMQVSCCVIISLIVCSCVREITREIPQTPNIVIIYADDLGYGDLGCFGHPTIRTPHLDRMAEQGARLTQFYSAASVCTPSRAALLTGRLPIRSGMSKVLFQYSREGLSAKEITIARLLKQKGYVTACIGKWHLGHLPPFLPTRHGFDTYYGVPYSNDMKIDPNMVFAENALYREGMNLKGVRTEKPTKDWVPLMRNEKVIEYPVDQATLTQRYIQESVSFIETNKDQPFFLYLAHTMPHVPLYVSDVYKDTSLRGLYGDVIEEIDGGVGQILDILYRLGLSERTLVLFSSDNGPWLTYKQHGGSAGLLKEGKGTTWEGGMREPTVAWWPGTIKAGSVLTDMAGTLDVLPTIADLVDMELPGDRIYDGVSMLPLLSGRGPGRRSLMFYYYQKRLLAIRKGPWKMHDYVIPSWGKKPQKQDPPLLFNLEQDPSEQYNLADKHPEIIKDLMQEMEKHKQTLNH